MRQSFCGRAGTPPLFLSPQQRNTRDAHKFPSPAPLKALVIRSGPSCLRYTSRMNYQSLNFNQCCEAILSSSDPRSTRLIARGMASAAFSINLSLRDWFYEVFQGIPDGFVRTLGSTPK